MFICGLAKISKIVYRSDGEKKLGRILLNCKLKQVEANAKLS